MCDLCVIPVTLVPSLYKLDFMAEETPIGSLHLWSDRQPCEVEGCEEETNETIWDGERWHRICDEHQSAFQNELRWKELRGR